MLGFDKCRPNYVYRIDKIPGGHPGSGPKSDRTKCMHVVWKSPGGVKNEKHSGLKHCQY